jgi:allantoin racemase
VLTYGKRVIPIYADLVAGYGLDRRVVRVDAIDFPPEAAFRERKRVLAGIVDTARALVEREGAEAIVLAGAAMAGFKDELQPHCPVPLIDCMSTAVPLAEMLVKLNLPRPQAGSLRHPGPRTIDNVDPKLAALFTPPEQRKARRAKR